MCDHQLEAAGAQLAGGCAEIGHGWLEGCFEQHPPASGRTLRERVQLPVAERRDIVGRQLATATDLESDAGLTQVREQLLDASGQLGNNQAADMWRGDDPSGAIRDRHPRELEGLAEVARAVIDAWQQVEVKLGAHLFSVPLGAIGVARLIRRVVGGVDLVPVYAVIRAAATAACP